MARRNDDDSDEKKGNENDSDDTFGLPEIEYNPISRGEESSPSTPTEPESQPYSYEAKAQETKREYSYVPPEEEAPVWPKVLGILFVVLVALGAALYFIWYKPMLVEKEKLAAKQKIEAEAKKREADLLAEAERIRLAAEQRKADSLANASKTGVYEQLSAPTGRYYVVIASAVDVDLLTDHAKKLGKAGVSSKIIPPYGKYKFYRLTIAEGDTFASAQDIANTKKSEYGENTWVLKY